MNNQFKCQVCDGSGKPNRCQQGACRSHDCKHDCEPEVMGVCPNCNAGFVQLEVPCDSSHCQNGIIWGGDECEVCQGTSYRPLTPDELEELVDKTGYQYDLVSSSKIIDKIMDEIHGDVCTFNNQPVRISHWKGE